MPSLRRSLSSPAVRSSPYPSSLALSPAARARAAPLHPRRSASATAERRVLADIEWWRVCDGQSAPDPQHHAREEEVDVDVPPGGTVTLFAGAPLHSLSLDSIQSDPLAALSIAPHSPPAGRHGRDSSVESTSELPLESVQLDLASPLSCPFEDLVSSPLSLTRAAGRQAHPLFGLRSVSAPGSSHRTLAPDFADMGGDSFSLDQNLFSTLYPAL